MMHDSSGDWRVSGIKYKTQKFITEHNILLKVNMSDLTNTVNSKQYIGYFFDAGGKIPRLPLKCA